MRASGKKLLASALVLSAMAPVAQADTIAINLTTYSSMVRVLTLSSPSQQIGTEPLQVTNLTLGSPSFLAFCAEPFQAISSQATTFGETYSSAGSYSGANAAAVQTLFNGYFGNVMVSTDEATAFQLALWELVSDTGANITSGSFAVASSPADATAINRAQQMLDNVSPAAGNYTLNFYTSATSQDILSAVPVPEPGTYLMMLLGLAGVAAAVRRTSR